MPAGGSLPRYAPGGGPLAARLLGEDLVLWRSGDEYLAWRTGTDE